MKKGVLLVIGIVVFGLIFSGGTSFIPGEQGLSFAQERGVKQAAKRARELAAEALAKVTEAENKLAVSRAALDAARQRGDTEAEQAILSTIERLESIIDTARELAETAAEVAEKTTEAKTPAGANAAVNSIKASLRAIDTISSAVTAAVSLTVAVGAGDVEAAAETERLSAQAEEAASEAADLASEVLEVASEAIETTDETEAASASEQAQGAIARATELSEASEVASAQAEEATAEAAEVLGIAPPPAAPEAVVVAEIESREEEEAAKEMGQAGSTEGVSPSISNIAYPGTAIGTGTTVVITGFNIDENAEWTIRGQVSPSGELPPEAIDWRNRGEVRISLTPQSGFEGGGPVTFQVTNPDGRSRSFVLDIPAFPTLDDLIPFSETGGLASATREVTIYGANFGTDPENIEVKMTLDRVDGGQIQIPVTVTAANGTTLTVQISGLDAIDPNQILGLQLFPEPPGRSDRRVARGDLTVRIIDTGNFITLSDGFQLQLRLEGFTPQRASIVR